jgi:hypothetical protein
VDVARHLRTTRMAAGRAIERQQMATFCANAPLRRPSIGITRRFPYCVRVSNGTRAINRRYFAGVLPINGSEVAQ